MAPAPVNGPVVIRRGYPTPWAAPARRSEKLASPMAYLRCRLSIHILEF